MTKGGKLKAKEVKDFLKASYYKTPPNDLDGYILDKSLSTATAKVYYNPQTNHAVVAHRGTKGGLDWGNNLAYALGAYEYTDRYKQGKKTQDKAEAKYGKSNISTLGHSQGSVLARKLGTDTQEVINVNPLYTNERPAKNEYNIRSSTDVVSALYAPVAKTREILFPKYSEKHDITIPSQSATDVLGEHSYEILDRLGDKEIGVGAGNKISSNNIMYKAGKRYSRLGYTGDDIDWVGGAIHTNNNCGAVGTPYVNRGTNPYGTRGGDRGYSEEKGIEPEEQEQEQRRPERRPERRPNININNLNEREILAFANWADRINQQFQSPFIEEFVADLRHQVGWLGNEMVDDNIRDIINNIDIEIETAREDEEEQEQEQEQGFSERKEGGKVKNPFKKVGKAFNKAGDALNTGFAKASMAVNPMTYVLNSKEGRNLGIKLGETTNDYLLPAVVSAGKPLYDAAAAVGSTALTGNPVLGKVAADTLWNEMVAKRGADPRERQKSKELGELSGVLGQAASKPFAAALGGMRRDKAYRYRLKGGASYDQIGEAAAIRNFRNLDPTQVNCPAPIKKVLNDIVHSGDFEGEHYSIFEDLSFSHDKDVERFLDAISPTYANQYYHGIKNWARANGIDFTRNPYILRILTKIRERYPNAPIKIPDDEKWGLKSLFVHSIVDENRKKPRGERRFTKDEMADIRDEIKVK